ncbi:MAG: long-chain fatty acid--CoA ligase [Bacteroidetes bacterium]|nr:long-chain fatty acid--CoA ligase [Bacteroidota bacterium]
MFRHAAFVIHDPSDTYLIRKEKGAWREYSYTEILDFIDQITSWLMEHNLEKGDRVALILENCPEYYCIDQSLQKLGLVNVSIYPTITPEETAFILNDSGAKILFIGNSFLYKKFKKVEDHCPEIKMLVVFPEDIAESDKCIHYSNLLSTGGTMYSKWKETIESRFANVEKEDMATLIYTSGTTGVPKGAMLTQYNFLSNCYDALELVPNIDKNDRYLSFLPLCHVYERMATNYLSHYIGAQVAFAESIEKVAQNITEIKPTIMACVPRLLERIHDKVVKNAKEAGKLKYAIFKWCIRVGDKERELKEAGKTPGAFLKWKLGIAEKLVYSKIKEKMGGRMRLFVSGGGALPPHVGKFFANLGLKVQEGYGLTETSPFITVNEFHRQIYGTVGRVAPRQQVAIQDVETKEIIALQDYYSFKVDFASGEGEILAKGPNIMKGYWNNPKETALVFDAEGWFHTGDIGRFDRGYLKITDRLKNMLVTSLGKNIYPTQLENNYLKSEKIEQIFIIGDKREFVTAIVVPTREELERVFGVDEAFFNMEDPFIREKNIVNWVFSDIKILSENLAKFERVKEILVKRKPFSMEDGDMTITLKIRRKVVMEKFAEEIENLYV